MGWYAIFSVIMAIIKLIIEIATKIADVIPK